MLGPYGWGNEALHEVPIQNRDLLIEFCTGTQTIVAHTYFDTAVHQKITYMEPGARPYDEITKKKIQHS